MKKTILPVLWFLPLSLLVSCVVSPEQQEGLGEQLARTSVLCSGGAVFPDPNTLATPQLMIAIGNSHLPITTKEAQAQVWFDQGVNLLHGFYHLEAYRAFREVAELDPNCAMAYWGMAMCQPGFGGGPKIWQTAIAKAVQLAGDNKLSAIETDLIEALETTMNQGISTASAHWQNIVRRYADQYPDAMAFAAIMLRQIVATDNQSNNIKQMLELALSIYPNHIGLGHYYTHVMETRDDFLAAKAIAEQAANLAPNAPHLTHMPGHIYFLEGDYAKTVAVFETAKTKEEAYHEREKIPYSANQNYLHNLHYLAVAYSELGQKNQALTTAQRYASITLRQGQPLDGTAYMLLYEGRILPALVHLRFREYRAAAKQIAYWLQHPVLPIDNEIVRQYLEIMQTYCIGMEAVELANKKAAQQQLLRMDEKLSAFEQLGIAKQGTIEFKLVNQVYDLMIMARLELEGWLQNLDPGKAFVSTSWNQALELEAILPYDEPPRLMYPIGESLARLHLKRNEQKAAKIAADQALTQRPNSPIITGLFKK